MNWLPLISRKSLLCIRHHASYIIEQKDVLPACWWGRGDWMSTPCQVSVTPKRRAKLVLPQNDVQRHIVKQRASQIATFLSKNSEGKSISGRNLYGILTRFRGKNALSEKAGNCNRENVLAPLSPSLPPPKKYTLGPANRVIKNTYRILGKHMQTVAYSPKKCEWVPPAGRSLVCACLDLWLFDLFKLPRGVRWWACDGFSHL